MPVGLGGGFLAGFFFGGSSFRAMRLGFGTGACFGGAATVSSDLRQWAVFRFLHQAWCRYGGERDVPRRIDNYWRSGGRCHAFIGCVRFRSGSPIGPRLQ